MSIDYNHRRALAVDQNRGMLNLFRSVVGRVFQIVGSGGGQCLGMSRVSGHDGVISAGVLGSTRSGSLTYGMGTLPDGGSPGTSGAPPAAEQVLIARLWLHKL